MTWQFRLTKIQSRFLQPFRIPRFFILYNCHEPATSADVAYRDNINALLPSFWQNSYRCIHTEAVWVCFRFKFQSFVSRQLFTATQHALLHLMFLCENYFFRPIYLYCGSQTLILIHHPFSFTEHFDTSRDPHAFNLHKNWSLSSAAGPRNIAFLTLWWSIPYKAILGIHPASDGRLDHRFYLQPCGLFLLPDSSCRSSSTYICKVALQSSACHHLRSTSIY